MASMSDNVNTIKTQGGGGGALNIYDKANNQNLAEFKEGSGFQGNGRTEFQREVVVEDGANLYIGDNVDSAGGVAQD